MKTATASELSTIAYLKLKMFEEVGMQHALMDGFMEEVIQSYGELYNSGTARHFIIECEGEIVACAGAFVKDDIPYCFYRERKYGFIGDVYVSPDHRRKGYARRLTLAALDWFREQDIKTVRLLASHNARNLYESLGFKATDQMTVTL